MLTLEQARELRNTTLWNEGVLGELDLWINAELHKMKSCQPDDLFRHQLAIQVLERVKQLPDIVVDREE